MSLQPVRLHDVVQDVVHSCTLEAEARGCRLVVADTATRSLRGDPELLRRAVENVLRNAIRYAPVDSEIELRAEDHGAVTVVSIRDAGRGVPDELLQQPHRGRARTMRRLLMRNRWFVSAVWWAVGAAGVAATNFWETRSYTDWSVKEVEEMLTDSPWARRISVVVQVPPRASDDGGGGRGGGRGGDESRGGRGYPVAAPQLKMMITWRSALPVRQALVRLASGATGAIAGQPLLDRQEFYVVTLAGVPSRYSRATATAGTSSFLRRGRKMPIGLAEGSMQQDGATLTLIFEFPRTDPITLEDKEVEFVSKLGDLEIKKKFNLKELVFRGQLEL